MLLTEAMHLYPECEKYHKTRNLPFDSLMRRKAMKLFGRDTATELYDICIEVWRTLARDTAEIWKGEK